MILILKKQLSNALFKLMKRIYELSGRTLSKKHELILKNNINDCIKESGIFYTIKKIFKRRKKR